MLASLGKAAGFSRVEKAQVTVLLIEAAVVVVDAAAAEVSATGARDGSG